MLVRQTPDAPCNIAFTEEEWKVAYTVKYKKKFPNQPIKLFDMMNIIAQFGGYLNRKNDHDPGPTVIWNGLKKLRDFVTAKQAYYATE